MTNNTLRYTIDNSRFALGVYLVYDNVKENYVFRGTWEECQQWIDDKEKTVGT